MSLVSGELSKVAFHLSSANVVPHVRNLERCRRATPILVAQLTSNRALAHGKLKQHVTDSGLLKSYDTKFLRFLPPNEVSMVPLLTPARQRGFA